MSRKKVLLCALLLGAGAVGLAVDNLDAGGFPIARIYIEYNASANDLGFHVFLDGEDWKTLKIENPAGTSIFEVTGKGGYADLGLTELFFEGAEPNLDEFPLADLLALFPEGRYTFQGTTVDGSTLTSTGRLSHAVPEGPEVSAKTEDGEVTIMWDDVDEPPDGFPDRRIVIVGYQVIVGSFQVTIPATSREVELPDEFVESLGPGEHDFEVLAIDRSGNQTITEGTFSL